MKNTKIEAYVIDKVREKRKKCGLSQEDLSIILGFASSGYIGKIESQKYSAHYNLNHLNLLAKHFKCKISDFLPDTFL